MSLSWGCVSVAFKLFSTKEGDLDLKGYFFQMTIQVKIKTIQVENYKLLKIE